MSDIVLVCNECRPNFVIRLDMDDSADQKLFQLIWEMVLLVLSVDKGLKKIT